MPEIVDAHPVVVQIVVGQARNLSVGVHHDLTCGPKLIRRTDQLGPDDGTVIANVGKPSGTLSFVIRICRPLEYSMISLLFGSGVNRT